MTLDLLRGCAAIAVALFHFNTRLIPAAYLAVDLFFALSGVVLYRAYQDRLQKGLVARDFMRLRVIRLYPLFAIGILLGLAHGIQSTWRGADVHLPATELLTSGFFGLLMLPDPYSTQLFPVNAVFWSIFIELIVNLAYCLGLYRLTFRQLVGGTIIGATLLIIQIAPPSFADSGQFWSGFVLSVTRGFYSFTIGLCIGSASSHHSRRHPYMALLTITLFFVALFVVPPIEFKRSYDAVVIILFIPCVVAIAVGLSIPNWMEKFATTTGGLSYALYATHAPIAHAIQFLERRIKIPLFIALPTFIIASLTVAWLVTRYFESPLRAALRRVSNVSSAAAGKGE